MLKKVALIIFLLALVGGAIGLYLYFKPARNYRDAKSDITVNAADIIHDFVTDEKSANLKYLNKVVEVHGIVNDISNDDKGLTNINLNVENEMAMVSCAMDSAGEADYSKIVKGSPVKIKGQCSGMLMDIIMIKCVIVKQ